MKNIWRVRSVDMCIYIDNHIYEENYNEDLIFGYLQWLFYSLSIKKKYFKVFSDYDNYALYAATQTYLRLTDKRQFLPDSDPRKMNKIKSVLNFIKRIMYPLKVNYQKSTFNGVIKIDENSEYDGLDVYSNVQAELASDIIKQNSPFLSVEIESYLSTLQRIIKKVVKETPYRNDKTIIHRLYISCLVSFLRSITLSRCNHEKLFTSDGKIKKVSESYIDNIYEEELLSAPICWRLPDNFKSYINVLITKAKKLISKDIQGLIHDYELSENMIQDILMTPISELNEENNS